MAARSILKGSRVAQIAMVGPIGDEYGEQAKHMLEKGGAPAPAPAGASAEPECPCCSARPCLCHACSLMACSLWLCCRLQPPALHLPTWLPAAGTLLLEYCLPKHLPCRPAVSQAFPGRVWNGAGLYAMGAEKEQLCMAAGGRLLCPTALLLPALSTWLACCQQLWLRHLRLSVVHHIAVTALTAFSSAPRLSADFFLCPSRFEPCGLADIEFGWLGAVMIGHNTGAWGGPEAAAALGARHACDAT